jgi:hypothetical protein
VLAQNPKRLGGSSPHQARGAEESGSGISRDAVPARSPPAPWR